MSSSPKRPVPTDNGLPEKRKRVKTLRALEAERDSAASSTRRTSKTSHQHSSLEARERIPTTASDALAALPASATPATSRIDFRLLDDFVPSDDSDSEVEIIEKPVEPDVVESTTKVQAPAQAQKGGKPERNGDIEVQPTGESYSTRLYKAKDDPCLLFFVRLKPADCKTGTIQYTCIKCNEVAVTFTASANGNKTPFTSHLSKEHEHLHELCMHMRKLKRNDVPIPLELQQIAHGVKGVTTKELAKLIGKSHMQCSLADCVSMAKEKQGLSTQSQKDMETELFEWLAAEDLPFVTVESKAFKRFFYNACGNRLKLPGERAMRLKLESSATEARTQLRNTLEDTHGVALSLDAWTSTNGISFLAIIGHFITADFSLHEQLIEFCEIDGKHSGENLARIVCEVAEDYDIADKIVAITSDNASNNDTMMNHFARTMSNKSITVNVADARIRCMPHIIHLAVTRILEDLKVGRAAVATDKNFQEGLQVLDNAAEVGKADEPESPSSGDASGFAKTLRKVRQIAKTIRKSPQLRQKWQDKSWMDYTSSDDQLMIILDVSTRWSSTYAMLERILCFQEKLNEFCFEHLREWLLLAEDWARIKIVANWLKPFRDATESMSKTKSPTLGKTFAHFFYLLKVLSDAKSSIPFDLMDMAEGITNAESILRKYIALCSHSSLYFWAMFLDPGIGFAGADALTQHDRELNNKVLDARKDFEEMFRVSYDKDPCSGASSPVSEPSQSSLWTSMLGNRRRQKDQLNHFIDNVEADPESDPLEWWRSHHVMYPDLARVAQDYLCVPGSSVAVERVFSGGRDLLAIRRQRLTAESIRNLMIVKHSVRRRM